MMQVADPARPRRLLMRVGLVLVAVAALGTWWISGISDRIITNDATATVSMAVNLVHEGVLSAEQTSNPSPTMYREPLPAVVYAAIIAWSDARFGSLPVDQYLRTDRAVMLKYNNVLWALVLSVATAGIVFSMTASFPTSFVAGVVITLPIPGVFTLTIDTLFTEPMGMALLALACWPLVAAINAPRYWKFAVSGIAFGALILTKAIFLYVGLGLLLALFALRPWWTRSPGSLFASLSLRHYSGMLATFALATAVVVVPWMARNYTALGTFAVSERAGLALYTRAIKNQMTREEYKGTFYAWAPHGAVRRLVGEVSGFSPDDLRRGGRLQRLNRDSSSDFIADDRAAEAAGRPEDALTYYRTGRAWRVKLVREFAAAGSRQPGAQADRALDDWGRRMILDAPLDNAKLLAPVLWRGAALSTPVLLGALILGLRRRRDDIVVLALPALGMVTLYTLATPFEYRFGRTVMPLVVILLLVLPLHAVARRIARRGES